MITRDRIVKSTMEFAEQFRPKEEMSELAKSMQEAILEDFPDHLAESMIDTLNAVLPGKDRMHGSGLYKHVLFACVVPIDNQNDHNYEAGEPVLVVMTHGGPVGYGLRADGTVGNKLPAEHGCIRPAYPEEIDEFLAKINEALAA
jgi:hypothetical protein